MANTVIKHNEPLVHIAKRDDMAGYKAWLIRIGAIVIAMLLVGVISTFLTGASFGKVYQIMFKGVFGRLFEGKTTMLWRFLQQTAILLCLALAVTPAFRMKFWNCGAEGQALIGGFAAMVCMIELGGKMSDGLLLLIICLSSVVAGAVWGMIPALFKAYYKTNETLFTLMMNYVATQIVSYYVYIKGSGSGVIQPVWYGNIPVVLGQKYLANILVVFVLMVSLYVYLKYSKHGYEIAVVGESQNTARYVGINVKKVIIRTMCISGALCGIAGMLLVSGTDHSINTNTVGGQGFTAIMVSWLAKFNPLVMVITSALISLLNSGASQISQDLNVSGAFPDVITGIILFFIIGSEFFINYEIHFRGRHGRTETGKEAVK